MRKLIVAGNWKMNTTVKQGRELFQEINNMNLSQTKDDRIKNKIEVLICPPFTHLAPLLSISPTSILLGAQNCSYEAKGAFTGEVSAEMIGDLGIKYVLIGHSERRLYFHENSEQLTQKINLALENNLFPIFCIGETKQERESGNFLTVIKNQIEDVLFHLSEKEFSKIILAYEPVWAIGTGLTASPEQAQEVHLFIRETIKEKYLAKISENLTLLYGGSCTEKNAKDLFTKPDIDGGLIGGASLKAKEFLEIAQILNRIKNS